MIENTRHSPGLIAAGFVLFMGAAVFGAKADDHRPPAGQICPQGSFVIGFDHQSNILCTESCGNGVLNDGEACDDGNTGSGDGCSSNCEAESVAAAVYTEKSVSEPLEQDVATTVSAMPVVARPFVEDVEPSTAVWGENEITVTIIGSGFNSKTSVRFTGTTYTPSVNQAGTELTVRLVTRGLAIGRYPITVSNGPEMETTVKKGLEIF